jgi:RecB family exonuclease
LNPLAAARLRAKLGRHVEGLPLGGLLRTARESSLEEPFLFFLALSMPERELVLSYPTVDERGSPTVRSPFVDEVAACLDPDLEPQRTDPGRLIPAAAEACEPGELVGRAALDRWTRRVPDRLTPALRAEPSIGPARLSAIDRRARIEERRARYFLARRGADKDALSDAFVGRLRSVSPELAGRLDATSWSPTHLEALASCGFKYFAARVLGLAENLPPTLDVDARERGNLFHALAAVFFRAHPVLPANLSAARALVPAHLAAARGSGARAITAKDPAFLDLEWRQLERILDAVVVREHGIQQEQAAAGIVVERLLETELTRALGEITLSGRPDRVELHRQGEALVRIDVLDYKVSRNRQRFKKLVATEQLGQQSLQIPIYLLLALGHAGRAGHGATLSGGYLLVKEAPSGQLVQCELTREQLEAEETGSEAPRSVVRFVTDLIARARAGGFDVDPDPCDQYCPFRGVCRYQEPPMEEEGETDD